VLLPKISVRTLFSNLFITLEFIKLIFSQASTIIPPSPLTCALGAQSSGQFSGSPNCVAGTDGTSQTIWVSNLISG
jgi:hypothetical protein